MIGTMCRTPEEWYAHPQGEILAQTPLIEIVRIGDSEPELPPLTNASDLCPASKSRRSLM